MKVFSNIRFCEFRQKIAKEIRRILYLRTRQMSSFRPLPYAQYFQTFMRVFLVLTVFLFTAFFSELL